MYANDLILNFEAERDAVRAELTKLRDRAAFLEEAISEIRKAIAPGSVSVGAGRTAQGRVGGEKRERRKPVKAEVPASRAVLNLLEGCRMGLPASEIIGYVTEKYGHRPNSLRTTLYNLKKSGEIVLDETGVYNHAENIA